MLDADWDQYSADEVVTVSGPMIGMSDAGLTMSDSNHVVRQLLASGHWMTTTDYSDFRPFVPDPQGVQPFQTDIARMVAVDDGSEPQYYTAAGALVVPATPDPSEDLTSGLAHDDVFPPGSDTIPRWTPVTTGAGGAMTSHRDAVKAPSTVRALGAPAAGSATPASPSVNARDWLDNIVITADARTRLLARVERKFGKSASKVGRLNRYVVIQAENSVETLVDPDIGAVVEENVAEHGRLRSHLTRAFSPTAEAGTFVLARTTMQIGNPAVDGPVLTIETALHNVRATRSGKTAR